MKEKPIIFSIDMIKAIIDGRKFQTRRVIKPQPVEDTIIRQFENEWQDVLDNPQGEFAFKCPFGQVGDRFVILESIEDILAYVGDGEITDIRVERLQEIPAFDIVKEGIPLRPDWNYKEKLTNWFIPLWNSIYKKGYHWEDNPFVWVIQFKRVK